MNKIPIDTNVKSDSAISPSIEHSGCNSCGSQQHCSLGFFATLFPRKNINPEIPLNEVEIITHTFLLYIVPIILLIAGSALAQYWYPSSTIIAVLFAFVGFGSGVILLALKRSIPKIL